MTRREFNRLAKASEREIRDAFLGDVRGIVSAVVLEELVDAVRAGDIARAWGVLGAMPGAFVRLSEAERAAAARQAVKAAAVDLVVLDIMMPGEDGLALCRHLRETTRIPVILLTAMGEETDRIVGLEVGADDYVAKPFNPRELLARIKAVIRRAQSLPPGGAARGAPSAWSRGRGSARAVVLATMWAGTVGVVETSFLTQMLDR